MQPQCATGTLQPSTRESVRTAEIGACDETVIQNASIQPANTRSAGNGHNTRCHNTRANIYAMLAALFRTAPTRALLEDIVPSVADAAEADGEYADAWRQLAAAVHHATPPQSITDSARPGDDERDDEGGVLTDDAIDDEYHNLFIGVVRGELMPYGSWYLSGYLMDRPLAKLRSDLDALGFERMPDVKEPEDHVAALFETMAMIIAAPDISERAEKTFFERHIQSWVGVFFKDLIAAKQSRFYKAVGEFGTRFMTFERHYFGL